MDKNNPPSEDARAMMAAGIEQARGAMENYLQFFQKGMSVSPWAGSELNNRLTNYVQQNVTTAFDYGRKLVQAKDLQEVVRIQTEFFQTQLNALTEQTKDLGEIATKVATSSFKGPRDPST
jgi:phasin